MAVIAYIAELSVIQMPLKRLSHLNSEVVALHCFTTDIMGFWYLDDLRIFVIYIVKLIFTETKQLL